MVKLIRWLVGYVEFCFTDGFIDGFINACYQNRLAVHDLKKCKAGLTGCCTAKQYKALHRIAFKNGGTVKITKKHGIMLTLLNLKSRVGLVCGALAFVLIINLLGGFVWNIEIIGNEKISDETMLAFLADNDFKIGTKWKGARTNSLEAMIMASFEDCAWVSINQTGTTARVEINETVKKPPSVDKAVTNVRAIKDGVIVNALVYNGWQAVRIGEAVTQGDLLISGVRENEEQKTNIFAHASGEVIARVDESINITINRQQTKKEYTDKRKYKRLIFFGIKIPLYIIHPPHLSCDEEKHTKYARLNRKNLPVGIEEITIRPYVKTTVTLSDSELNALVQEEIQNKIKNDFYAVKVVRKNVDISLNADNVTATGTITCHESIGKEYKIKGAEKYLSE